MACAIVRYYITTPVLTKLLESRCFESVTVMVQKEVAQRICAVPGSKAYGAFTVFCNWYAAPALLFDVPPDCFLPRPKVTSAVLRLAVRALSKDQLAGALDACGFPAAVRGETMDIQQFAAVADALGRLL